MEQIFNFLSGTSQITFAIMFIISLIWGASKLSDKTGQNFRQSLSCVWWLAICIMAGFVSLFTAFFGVFQ